MPDPVAEKSTFLRMYMSNHPDTLVAYAKWFGKVKEAVKSAEMSYIDCKSMTLACILQDGSTKTVIVPIQPALRGYEDVKPRLLEMKALAQEGLGMTKSPKITGLTLTFNAFLSFLFTLFFAYLHLGPRFLLSMSQSTFAGTLQTLLGPVIISFAFWTVLSLHTLESLYTLYLCRTHSAGLLLGTVYVGATFLCGFPVWIHLRKKVQQARIDSVMKVQ